MTTIETPTTTGIAGETDAIAFLIGQHMAIRDLFAEVGAAPAKERATAFERLVRLLAVHETAEQQVLRPVTRASIDGGEGIADARIAEEREAKQMLAELERIGPAGDRFLPMLETLRSAVLTHAHNEEAYEFRYLKAMGDTGQPLTAMIKASEAIAPTHPHPRVNSATAHTLTGPVVSMFDRARDALRNAIPG